MRQKGPNSSADTIFAVSTAPGRAGIAVIRVSGPCATDAFQLVQGEHKVSERRAIFRRLIDASTGDRIDDGVLLWFRAPRSYTGEDIVEFQVHGGRAVVSALLGALSHLPNFRPAEPGEFTRRAVEHGRMDLTRAEAIADLVAADTEEQRRLALRQYDGSLSDLYGNWRARLVRTAAWVEAAIDFSEDELPGNISEQTGDEIRRLLTEIRAHLNDRRRGEIVREGFQVAILGPPNVGKSSLVNALARRDVAIVSDIPGTTRDVIEVKLDLAGYPVVLADTAGLHASAEPVEAEGIRRARARAESADFRLVVLDATSPSGEVDGVKGDLVVRNKADLVVSPPPGPLLVSAKTGEGLDELIRVLSAEAALVGSDMGSPLLTRARHRKALEDVESRLEAALQEDAPELAAENLRAALHSLGRVTGVVDVEELLDVVFRDFCIGK